MKSAREWVKEIGVYWAHAMGADVPYNKVSEAEVAAIQADVIKLLQTANNERDAAIAQLLEPCGRARGAIRRKSLVCLDQPLDRHHHDTMAPVRSQS